MKTSSAFALLQYRNTPSVRTVFPRHRSSTADLSRTCSQLTADHFQMNGSKVQRGLKSQPHTAGRKQKLSTMPIHVTSLRFESDLTLPSKTQRPSYGTYMAQLQTLGHIVDTILKHRVAVFWCEIVVSCTIVSQHRFPTHRTNNLPKANQLVYRDSPVANATQQEGSLRTPLGFSKDIQHLCQYPPQKLGREVCVTINEVIWCRYITRTRMVYIQFCMRCGSLIVHGIYHDCCGLWLLELQALKLRACMLQQPKFNTCTLAVRYV